jgi:hypothetical protein
MWLHLVQPLLRGWHRHLYVLQHRRLPAFAGDRRPVDRQAKRIGLDEVDLYWESEEGLGRTELLGALIGEAHHRGWPGQFGNEWAPWDLELIGDRWHDITVLTATEELGWPRRFTRARCKLHLSFYGRTACLATSAWTVAALASMKPWAMLVALGLLAACAASAFASMARCRRAVSTLLWQAGLVAGLAPVDWRGGGEQPADGESASPSDNMTPIILIATGPSTSMDPVGTASLFTKGSNHAC